MSSRPHKHQRTTSTTADETPPLKESTAGLKARVSQGDDTADLKSLLHTISTCHAKANGYNFFHPPPPSATPLSTTTRMSPMWACKYSTKHLITSAPSVHLYSHGFRCTQDKGKAVECLSDTPAWEGMGKSEGCKVLQQFALWCACNGHPFGITDDDKLPHLFDEVARRHRPSASAILVAVNDLSNFCAAECTYGTIYLALDAWTARNSVEVLGVLAFFKTKAGSTELLEHVVPLDFIVLVNTHATLPKCDRTMQVMGIASDNTSNMGRMMDEVSEYGLGQAKWVRCWAHILNLVVTTIFAYFDSTTVSRFVDPRPESEGEDPSVEGEDPSVEGEDPSVEDQHLSQIEGVLPMIDLLVRHLEGFLNDPNTVPALHNTIILGLEKLFDYYGKTGNCPYYAAAILLHPVGSTCYLKCQNWPQVWIDDAIEATQALYNTRHFGQSPRCTDKGSRSPRLVTTIKSILELLNEDDKDDIGLDLDNIVHNFATTKCVHVNIAGQPISALDYWKRQYVAGEMNKGLTELALDIFRCP
ncbi:hypothetical protein JCM21900_003323, partial [Sporobolomyces salmonicolor]